MDVASGFAFGYDPTGCSVYLNDCLFQFDPPAADINYSIFNLQYSIF